MRDILFKAKRIDNGEWVEGWIVPTMSNTYHDGYRIIDLRGINYDELDFYEPSFISWEVDKNTICQYTGLTDKNGNKIWENDVVCFNNAEKCVVRYRFGAFEFSYRACANSIYAYVGTDLYLDKNTLDMEVIGNIFDNPELIGE